jgi:hypothetical protein
MWVGIERGRERRREKETGKNHTVCEGRGSEITTEMKEKETWRKK